MHLTSKSQKILKYIYRHKSGVTRIKLIKKFHCIPTQNEIDKLVALGYISHDYTFQKDSAGFPIGEIPDTAIYTINDSGIVEVEKQKWFNTQYVVTNIFVPIVIALLTYTLTYFLSKYF